MRNLRDELAYRYSPDAALRAVDILGQMRLPLPIAGEFLAGKESLHLPLHRHGITLRFGDPANRVQSDHFLNRFVRIPLGNTADFNYCRASAWVISGQPENYGLNSSLWPKGMISRLKSAFAAT